MKKRMAILMSMAIAANMIASVPVCATDIFTDSMPTDSAITQETDDDSFSDGSGTPDFADEQENVQAAQDEGTQNAKEPPEVTAEYDSVFGSSTYKINGQFGIDYVDNIQQISVNGNNLTESSFSSYLTKGKYYLCGSSDQYIRFSADSFEVNDQIVITSTGYKDLTLKVTGTGKQWAVEKVTSQTEPEQPKDAPTFVGDQVEILYTDYKIIKPADENTDSDYISKITEISVDGTPWDKTDRATALFNRTAYYPDSSNNRVVFDSTVLHTGNVITIKSNGYKELHLKVNAEGNAFTVVATDSGETNIKGASNGVNTLHVRLKGYFESAVTGQKKYDAVSGASTSVSSNKNSNVVVEAADLPDGKEPVEDDWKELTKTSVKIDTKNTKVNIDSKSGMAGMYSPHDSSLSLSGTPAEIGTYPVSVTLTDESGRTVTSNELTFKVYSTNEKLADHLKLANATKTADGKYMYDMEPWAIKNFTLPSGDQTVVVPADVKAWYGSHTSGTYGKLGYAVPEGTLQPQTLILPKGCDLTLVNMDILSSVKIVVQDGAKLTLRDSVIQGAVEVENGGTFSMNYNDYGGGEFLNGASINGKLILKDGSTLENAKIYSNTNNIANGSEARRNTDPVVVINGNVKLKGKVFLRGDEAPTGTDPATGKSYTGQAGLQVNGTLTLEKDAVLAVFGGGKDATTSNGGTAIRLNGGTITGEGKLIAVGGDGHFGEGGDAVSGNGTISVADAYLEGGASVSKSGTAGKALGDHVKLSGNTNRKLIDGKTGSAIDYDHDTYWRDILALPDLSLYTVEKNAPGEGSTDQEKPGVDQEKPGGSGDNGSGDNGSADSGSNGTAGNGNNPNGSSSGGTAGNGSSQTGDNSAGTAGNGSSQTGDASTPLLWAAIMLTALALMGTTVLWRRKQNAGR